MGSPSAGVALGCSQPLCSIGGWSCPCGALQTPLQPDPRAGKVGLRDGFCTPACHLLAAPPFKPPGLCSLLCPGERMASVGGRSVGRPMWPAYPGVTAFLLAPGGSEGDRLGGTPPSCYADLSSSLAWWCHSGSGTPGSPPAASSESGWHRSTKGAVGLIVPPHPQ